MKEEPIEIFGEFSDQIPDTQEHLTINFSPSFLPRKLRWRNYGLSADFLGDYFANFFPGDEIPDSKLAKKETVKGSVSFIANELLENAMKYSEESAKLPISISLYLYGERLVFVVTNYTSLATANRYKSFIREIVSSDIEELYTRQLERAGKQEGASQMGLLTIINDYAASLGWKFQNGADHHHPELTKITIMAQLEI